jgi:tetraacyldisaccharide 4'-kinase
MRRVLYPFSLLYIFINMLVSRFTKRRRVNTPVVSVGNITWGGTGKTPVVISVVKELQSRGLNVAVLTRGYFRKAGAKKIEVVSDGKNILSTISLSGDEPMLLAQSLPGAVVIVGGDRFAAATHAAEKFAPDVFVLDDAFQHWRMHRDLDIVCVNALNPFGNGLRIPAGILREHPAALKRAGLVIMTNCDRASDTAVADLEKRLAAYTATPVIRSGYRTAGMRRIIDGAFYPVSKFEGRWAVAVSGIAENKSFLRSLEKIHIDMIRHYAFRDHHWYTRKELDDIVLHHMDKYPVLTTAKDAVRLKDAIAALRPEDAERFFALEIEIQITNGEEHWHDALQKIARSS